jgi:hypothetical protein
MPLTSSKGVRIPLVALLFLMAFQAPVFAQIGKVDCKDQDHTPWWKQVCEFCRQQKCCGAANACHKHCNPFTQEYYGYHPPQWRIWPGTQANVQPTAPALKQAQDGSALPAPSLVKERDIKSEAPAGLEKTGPLKQFGSRLEGADSMDGTKGGPGEAPPPRERPVLSVPAILQGPAATDGLPAVNPAPMPLLQLPPAPSLPGSGKP